MRKEMPSNVREFMQRSARITAECPKASDEFLSSKTPPPLHNSEVRVSTPNRGATMHSIEATGKGRVMLVVNSHPLRGPQRPRSRSAQSHARDRRGTRGPRAARTVSALTSALDSSIQKTACPSSGSEL